MKKNYALLGALLAATVSVAAPANASTVNSNWYAGASGDVTWPSHADTGGGGNVDLGYRLAPSDWWGMSRFELEAGYHTADGTSTSGDLRYFDYMANAYWDFGNLYNWGNSGWHVSPYVGGGAGLAEMREGSSSFSGTFHHNSNAFAYQGLAGLTLASADSPIDWTLGYRYFNTNQSDGVQVVANNVELGLHYHF